MKWLAASFEYPTGSAEAIASAITRMRGETAPKKVTLKSRVFTKDNVATGGEWLP